MYLGLGWNDIDSFELEHILEGLMKLDMLKSVNFRGNHIFKISQCAKELIEDFAKKDATLIRKVNIRILIMNN